MREPVPGTSPLRPGHPDWFGNNAEPSCSHGQTTRDATEPVSFVGAILGLNGAGATARILGHIDIPSRYYII
jgi:hypothetical protein